MCNIEIEVCCAAKPNQASIILGCGSTLHEPDSPWHKSLSPAEATDNMFCNWTFHNVCKLWKRYVLKLSFKAELQMSLFHGLIDLKLSSELGSSAHRPVTKKALLHGTDYGLTCNAETDRPTD